jgi:two-component system, OmpR family, sensor histidine kinase QseC
MHSIKGFLLISILAVMTFFYGITAYWNYDETLNDITHLFDEQLIDSNVLLQNSNPDEIDELEQLDKIDRGRHSVHRAYQVWNAQGELLYRSSDAMAFPLSNHQPGLQAFVIGDHTWHTYTAINPTTGLVTITAQRGDQRDALAHELAIRHIIPFLITFPMVSIAVLLLISHAFKPLNEVICQLNDRQYDNLSPIAGKAYPTELITMVESMNALFHRLNSAYEREQRFTADAAHELRTPLAATRTMAQLALGSKDIKSCHECLEDVLIGVDRCTHVVKQLAVLNSLRPEEIMHEVSHFNINTVIQQISNELSSMAQAKEIKIEKYMPSACMIEANQASIQILLRNLLDNAIRYSPEQSQITLSTEVTSEEALISVTDQGPGIPEELHERVFERFYRQLGTGQSGTGLGLSIVGTICDLHQAKIELGTGEEGKGLRVLLRFALTQRVG